MLTFHDGLLPDSVLRANFSAMESTFSLEQEDQWLISGAGQIFIQLVMHRRYPKWFGNGGNNLIGFCGYKLYFVNINQY